MGNEVPLKCYFYAFHVHAGRKCSPRRISSFSGRCHLHDIRVCSTFLKRFYVPCSHDLFLEKNESNNNVADRGLTSRLISQSQHPDSRFELLMPCALTFVPFRLLTVLSIYFLNSIATISSHHHRELQDWLLDLSHKHTYTNYAITIITTPTALCLRRLPLAPEHRI
jgi:hypothetical protein